MRKLAALAIQCGTENEKAALGKAEGDDPEQQVPRQIPATIWPGHILLKKPGHTLLF
jgi:hypothetical protein